MRAVLYIFGGIATIAILIVLFGLRKRVLAHQRERKRRERALAHVRAIDSTRSNAALKAAQRQAGFRTDRHAPVPVLEDVYSATTKLFGRAASSAEQEQIRQIFAEGLDGASQQLIQKRANDLLKAMPQGQRNILERVPIGFLPSLDLYSTETVVQGVDVAYIAINAGLVAYFNEAIKSTLAQLQLGDEKAEAGDRMIHLNRMDALLAAALPASRRAPVDRVWLNQLPPVHMLIHSWMMTGVELFLVAHEYAHLLCGHHYDKQDWPAELKLAMQRDVGMAVQASNVIAQAFEFEADAIGLSLAFRAIAAKTQPLERSYTIAGIGAMFSTNYVLERIALMEPDHDRHTARWLHDTSYPPSLMRHAAWRQNQYSRLRHNAEVIEIADAIHSTCIATADELLRRHSKVT